MSILKTNSERKSFAVTTVLMLLLFLLMFFFGLHYLIPPPESGIAVNFGTSETGSGPVQTATPIPEKIQEQPKAVSPPVSEKQPNASPEDVLTQENQESVVIPEKKKTETPKETPKKEVNKPVKTEKPVEKPKPTPDKSTTDALNNLLNAPATSGENNSKSDGITGGNGDQGNPNGDKNEKSYYGNSASGGGGNYQLAGRDAISKPKPKYICNEEGIVVVRVDVNRQGNVVSAQAGERGTTNNAACLLEQAKIAAEETKWQPKTDAPAVQTGFIIYEFSLKN
ncbi:MAG: energy transducer TonB [Flavobacteriaceae bacterium]|nr:energy transducer TonB [Flavobacteriaceae bacterium]